MDIAAILDNQPTVVEEAATLGGIGNAMYIAQLTPQGHSN
jgi:hypothetical protein